MNIRDETRHDTHKNAAFRYALLYIVTHSSRLFLNNRAKINIQFLTQPQNKTGYQTNWNITSFTIHN